MLHLKSRCWNIGSRSSSFFSNSVSFLCHLSWCSRFSLIKICGCKIGEAVVCFLFCFQSWKTIQELQVACGCECWSSPFVLDFFCFFFGWFSHRWRAAKVSFLLGFAFSSCWLKRTCELRRARSMRFWVVFLYWCSVLFTFAWDCVCAGGGEETRHTWIYEARDFVSSLNLQNTKKSCTY